MCFLKTGRARVRMLSKIPDYRTRTKIMVLAGLALAYVALFWVLLDRVGAIVAAFLVIPVFVAGLYFGSSAGLVASILGFGFNFLLLTNFKHYTAKQFIQLWPGYLIILIIGYIAGYIRDEADAHHRIGNEIESRERFITLVSIATKSITGAKKPEDAYYRLVIHLTNLFVADYAYLIRWDETNRSAYLVEASSSVEKTFSSSKLHAEESGLVEAVVQSRRAMVIEDVQTSPYVINPTSYKSLSLQTKSALTVPLITEDYCFGVVTLAFDAYRSFSPDEIVYVELAGHQIALALRTLQQQFEIEAQLREARALANIERALSESERVGVDKVLQLIVDSAISLIPNAKKVILHLLDEGKQILVPRAVAGVRGKARGKLNMRPGEGVAGHVMSTGKLITVADVLSETRFIKQTRPTNFRSLVVAPIKSYDKCIGTISIHSDEPNAFTESEVTLLETLGTQVSIAIENANLLESLEQRVQQRTHDLVVLYNLITIISENWQLQDLLELSLVLTLETMKVERGIIYLSDGKETPGLKPIIQRGFADGFHTQIDRLPGDELAKLVFKHHKPIVRDNLAADPIYENFNELQSYAGVPILVRGEMRGVFSLYGNEKGIFGPDEMALLTSIADHLGIGIENSILFEQSRENAVLEERNRLARNLHDSVSQLLYSLTLMAGSTKKMLERGYEMEGVKTSVTRLEDTAHQALKEMRLLLYELRPAVLDSEGLVGALQHRIETVEDRLGVKVDLQVDDLPELPSNIEDALYHIVLEALNNIVKHSGSATARIRLTGSRGNLVLEIWDNGKGFHTHQHHTGLGLRNMRERGQMVGCDITIDSKPGEGTRILVRAKIPSGSLIES